MKTTKTTWFRNLGATTTIKVPVTRNSDLAKRLRQTLTMYPGPKGTSVKVQEQPGVPILGSLAKGDPFTTDDCHRGDCPLGNQPCGGKCGKENILYRAICTRCRDAQIDQGVDNDKIVHSQYTGESARTIRTRAKQHFNDYHRCARTNQDPDSDMSSFMWDHHHTHHGGGQQVQNEDYEFQLLKQFRDPMTRQQEEATRIQIGLERGIHIDHRGIGNRIISLNRKTEYFAPRKRFNYEDQ